MTRTGAAKAWSTCIHTAAVSRSFRADTLRHCSAIGEAARVASTDAYGASRPIHVIDLSTLVYAYRFFPQLAVELAGALLAKGASQAQILSMLRWRSDEALYVHGLRVDPDDWRILDSYAELLAQLEHEGEEVVPRLRGRG